MEQFKQNMYKGNQSYQSTQPSEVSSSQKIEKQLTPVNLQKTEEAFSGRVFVSQNTYEYFLAYSKTQPVYVLINDFVFTLEKSNNYKDSDVGLHKYARQVLKISLTDSLKVEVFKLPLNVEYHLSQLELEIDPLQIATTNNQKLEIDDTIFEQMIRKVYQSSFFKHGQLLIADYQGNILIIKVTKTGLVSTGIDGLSKFQYGGQLFDETTIELTIKTGINTVKLKSTGQKVKNLFRDDFSFEQLGIGGLDKELANIFRRAFASRRFPSEFLEKYGIKHVKGILLFGPPGTGKTLIARQLAKVLKAKEPKIVNGPEIFSKYVGEAEENVRKLFKEAIEDQSNLGDESGLHIIVFDEMDAICKQRGTINSGAGAYDNVVNQLLSMIDGVNALNNILVIGMTNRKDLIDEAVLRPGRFEVHIEVGLPDEIGRQQILKIHTDLLYKRNAIDSDVSIDELATLTKNFTGAEIESLVKSASSFAFQRVQSVFELEKKVQNVNDFKISKKDFMDALEEGMNYKKNYFIVKPQFGIDTNKFDLFLKNQLIDYGQNFQRVQSILKNAIDQTNTGKNSQVNSILLEGDIGSGKTSIAAQAAIKCGFPYVKLISPELFIGFTEGAIINQIQKIFIDAYKSPRSCIVIDNIERIIEYVDIGPRFSNTILQTLLVLVKKIPDKGDNRLLIIGTTSQAKILKDLEVLYCFNLTVKVPNLTTHDEIASILSSYSNNMQVVRDISKKIHPIPVKRLLMILDMATHGQKQLVCQEFMECYENVQVNNYF